MVFIEIAIWKAPNAVFYNEIFTFYWFSSIFLFFGELSGGDLEDGQLVTPATDLDSWDATSQSIPLRTSRPDQLPWAPPQAHLPDPQQKVRKKKQKIGENQ